MVGGGEERTNKSRFALYLDEVPIKIVAKILSNSPSDFSSSLCEIF